MMLRYSFGYIHEADMLDLAVENVLELGMRTSDIVGINQKPISCSQMGDCVLEQLIKLSNK